MGWDDLPLLFLSLHFEGWGRLFIYLCYPREMGNVLYRIKCTFRLDGFCCFALRGYLSSNFPSKDRYDYDLNLI